MKKLYVILTVVLASLVVASVAAATPPDSKNFVSPMEGEQENPPVDTTAVGVAVYHLNAGETELSFKLIVANIENVAQAHIHCGDVGVNGPVVAFLYPAAPPPVLIPGRFDGILAQGTVSAANVIPRAPSAACPGGVANFADLIAKMRSGGAYTNAHTVAFPGGEIRGQIMEAGPTQ